MVLNFPRKSLFSTVVVKTLLCFYRREVKLSNFVHNMSWVPAACGPHVEFKNVESAFQKKLPGKN